jgi:hypothetical protein
MELRSRSAWLALGLAPCAVAQALFRPFAAGAWWPFWIDDIVVAAFLAFSGLMVLRESNSTRARMLSAAWGAMLLVLWSSTFGSLGRLLDRGDGYNPLPGVLLGLEILILAVSVLGLAWSLPTSKKPFIGTRPPKT